MPNRRIETKASQTADITCGCRAISFLETNPFLKCDDWVAPMLLPKKFQVLLGIPFTGRLLSKVFGPKGMYEWVIARTKYIDAQFASLDVDGFKQVVIIGAGFDSRAIRFKNQLAGTKVFELDAGTTQLMKSAQFRKRGLVIPDNTTLIPINFEMESFSQKLEKTGFQPGLKTLVLMEGVLQYLNPGAVSDTMSMLQKLTPPGSRLIFDYAHSSVLQRKDDLYGEKGVMDELEKRGESWQFGLDHEEVEPFLVKFGLKLIDLHGPQLLEKDYFSDSEGVIKYRINGTQSVLTAERF